MRDYRHAARIFVDNNYRLSPKYGFLFYVEFDFNPLITSISNLTAQEMGMIVKSVNLPKFTVDVKQHNAYNRKNYVQNSIKYDPVQITFHDDQADNVRTFWYDYYSFYYRDPDYADSTYTAPHKYQSRPSFDWGYSPRATVGYNNANGNQPYQYIQAIRIYSMYQKNFSEYELINPIITGFKHGDHTNSEGQGLLEHQMTVQFETVKYYSGYVTPNTVGGFVDLHYDNTNSPLTPSEGADIIDNGMGGYTRATDKTTDLAVNAETLSQLAPFITNNTGLSAASGFSSQLNQSTSLSASSGSTNAGGFGIPSLGSLTTGLTSSAIIGQQLKGTAASLAGTVTSQATNAVVGGLSKGLGPNGGAIIGLVASAISNPKLALTTVENMAISYATNKLVSAVTQATGSFFSGVGSTVAGAVSNGLSQVASATLPVSTQFSLGVGIYAQGSTAQAAAIANGDLLNSLPTWAFDSNGQAIPGLFDSSGNQIGQLTADGTVTALDTSSMSVIPNSFTGGLIDPF